MDLLEHLNPPQRLATAHVEGPMLILAGAGSGKTRVITHRMAYLVQQELAYPEQLLAVTFTNKAANEMRERVDLLLEQIGRPDASAGVTLSTFHSLGARLLRRHADRVGLTWSFQIYDDVDQYKLVQKLLQARDKDADQSAVRRHCAYLEKMKNRGLTPQMAHEVAFNQEDEELAWFYDDYQVALRQANCLDFGDLILAVLEMFRDDPELAASYSRQWRFLMVDEFQDTNPAQYELLSLLASEHNNLVVVGDDDQAIYRWRGATVANILGFEHDYKGAEIIKLEQNYRSTQIILDAADDVIQHNPGRRDKKLWTDKTGGELIKVCTTSDDREEAQFVAERIRLLAAKHQCDWDEFAVFFRTNAQARLFEEQLRFAGIPYLIVGGMSFYQREEIKDLLAYLKVALNPENSVDLLRVINTPSRGVGATTINKLLDASRVPGIGTVYDTIRFLLGADFTFEGELKLIEPDPQDPAHDEALEALETMRAKQLEGIKDFFQSLEALRDDLLHFDSLSEILRQFIERINYFAHIASKNPEAAEDKTRNVAELVNAIDEFEKDFVPEQLEGAFLGSDMIDVSESMLSDATAVRKLRAFLDQSALNQPVGTSEDDDDPVAQKRVTLMTVHGSKGLEFENVFLVGMEDDLFPSARQAGDAEALEEERRLAYVAITRAKQRLHITNARRRRVYGTFRDTKPSRFLLDIVPARMEIDKKSVCDKIDWTPKRQGGGRGRGKPISDDDRYFSDGKLADAIFSFDQSSPDEFAQANEYDEFSQAPPYEYYSDDVAQYSHEEVVYSSDFGEPEPPRSAEIIGAMVTHSRFGIGEVVSVSGRGDKANVTVNFPGKGEKKIIKKFLKILG